jgi:hypothetical protein
MITRGVIVMYSVVLFMVSIVNAFVYRRFIINAVHEMNENHTYRKVCILSRCCAQATAASVLLTLKKSVHEDEYVVFVLIEMSKT